MELSYLKQPADTVVRKKRCKECGQYMYSTKKVELNISVERLTKRFKYDVELTRREKEIIRLICNEYSYKEIGNMLGISGRTVETHKNNILKKIGAKKVTGIVVYAAKQDWIR